MPPDEQYYVLNEYIDSFNHRHAITPFTRALVLLRSWEYPGYLHRRYPRSLINAFIPPIPDKTRAHPAYQLLSNSMYDYLIDSMNSAGLPIHNWFLDSLRRIHCFHNIARHFHIRKDGQLAYTPAYKPTIMNDDDKWLSDGRQTMKMGRGIRHIFNSSNYKSPYTEHQVSVIGEKLMGLFNFDGRIEIVNGSKQIDYYHGSRYAERDTGTLANSCMRYDNCSDYVRILADAPNVEMVVAFDSNDMVIGRANIYHDATFSRGNVKQPMTFVDRIYGKPVTINAIENFCRDKGYVTKAHQNYHDTTEVVFPNGSLQSGIITCTIPINGHETIVYMDTFKYGFIQNDTLTLSNESGDLELTSTEGNYFNEERVYVRHLDGYYNEDDVVWSEEESEYIHCDDAVFSNHLQTYLFMDDSTYLEYDDDYLPDGHCDIAVVYSAHGHMTYAIDSNVRIDGYVPSVGHCNVYDSSDIVYDDYVGAFVHEQNISTVVVTDADGTQHNVDTVLTIEELIEKYSIEEIIAKCS